MAFARSVVSVGCGLDDDQLGLAVAGRERAGEQRLPGRLRIELAAHAARPHVDVHLVRLDLEGRLPRPAVDRAGEAGEVLVRLLAADLELRPSLRGQPEHLRELGGPDEPMGVLPRELHRAGEGRADLLDHGLELVGRDLGLRDRHRKRDGLPLERGQRAHHDVAGFPAVQGAPLSVGDEHRLEAGQRDRGVPARAVVGLGHRVELRGERRLVDLGDRLDVRAEELQGEALHAPERHRPAALLARLLGECVPVDARVEVARKHLEGPVGDGEDDGDAGHRLPRAR